MGEGSWGTEMKHFTVAATPEQGLEEWIGVCRVRVLRTRSADSFWPITEFPCTFHLPLLSLCYVKGEKQPTMTSWNNLLLFVLLVFDKVFKKKLIQFVLL